MDASVQPTLPPDGASPASADRDAMPRWVPRAIALFLGGATAVFVGAWLLGELQSLLMVLLVSLFLSFAFEPAVNWLAAQGLRRGVATGLVLFGGFLVTALFLGMIAQTLFSQVSEFIDDLPAYIQDLEDTANDRFGWEIDADELIDEVQNEDDQVQEIATNLAGSVLSVTVSAVGVLFNLFTIGLFTFYMVAEGPKFRRAVLQFLPPDRQEAVIAGWEVAIEKTGGYIYSRSLLALLSAVATSAVLGIMGVPYFIALGLWTGLVSQFIPTIGTYLAGALPVLVALLQDPVDALVVLIFIVLYQQVENYVFAPKITARTMDLHPAVAFGTVLVGAALFGPVGALVALPAAAVVQAISTTYVQRHNVIDTHMTRDAASVSGPAGRRRQRAERERAPSEDEPTE